MARPNLRAWAILALALLALPFAAAALRSLGAIALRHPPTTPIAANTKFPFTVRITESIVACRTSSIQRIESLPPLLIYDSFKILGGCGKALTGTGEPIDDGKPSCTFGSATVDLDLFGAFSFMPSSGSLYRFRIYFSDNTCDGEYTLALDTPVVLPGARLVLDSAANEALLIFYTYFRGHNGTAATGSNRIQIQLPERMQQVPSSPTPTVTYVVPAPNGGTTTGWGTGFPMFEAGPVRLNFFHTMTALTDPCDPCVLRISNVRQDPTLTVSEAATPGYISVLGPNYETATAEFGIDEDPATVTATVHVCTAGARPTGDVTLAFTFSSPLAFTRVRLDVPPEMRKPRADLALAGFTVEGVIAQTLDTDGLGYYTTTADGSGKWYSNTIRLVLRNVIMCPQQALSNYPLTATFLDASNALVATGTVEVRPKPGVIPVTMQSRNASELTMNNYVTSGQFNFDVTVDVAQYHAPGMAYILVIYSPIFTYSQPTVTISGDAGSLVWTSTSVGLKRVEFSPVLPAVDSICAAGLVNHSNLCKWTFQLRITFARAFMAFKPFDLQFHFATAGLASALVRRIYASGTARTPVLRPFKLPSAAPGRLVFVPAEQMWSASMRFSTLPSTGLPKGEVTPSTTAPDNCVVTTVVTNVTSIFVAASDLSYHVKCQYTLSAALFAATVVWTFTTIDPEGSNVPLAVTAPIPVYVSPTSEILPEVTVLFARTGTVSASLSQMPSNFYQWASVNGVMLRVLLPPRTDVANEVLAVKFPSAPSCEAATQLRSSPLRLEVTLAAGCAATAGAPLAINILNYSLNSGNAMSQSILTQLSFRFELHALTSAGSYVHFYTGLVPIRTSFPSLTNTNSAGSAAVAGGRRDFSWSSRFSPTPQSGYSLRQYVTKSQALRVFLPPWQGYFGVPSISFDGNSVAITRIGLTSEGPHARYYEIEPIVGATENKTLVLSYPGLQTYLSLPPANGTTLEFAVIERSEHTVNVRSSSDTRGTFTEVTNNLYVTAPTVEVSCSGSAAVEVPVRCFSMRATSELKVAISTRDNVRLTFVVNVRPGLAEYNKYTMVTVTLGGVRVRLDDPGVGAGHFTTLLTAATGLSYIPAGSPLYIDVDQYPMPLFTSEGYPTASNSLKLGIINRQQSPTRSFLAQTVKVTPSSPLVHTPLFAIDRSATSPSQAYFVKSGIDGQFTLHMVVPNDVPPVAFPSYFDADALNTITRVTFLLPAGLVGIIGVTKATFDAFMGTLTEVQTNTRQIICTLIASPYSEPTLTISLSGLRLSADKFSFVRGSFIHASNAAWVPDFSIKVTLETPERLMYRYIPIKPRASVDPQVSVIVSTRYDTALQFTITRPSMSVAVDRCQFAVDSTSEVLSEGFKAIDGAGQTTITIRTTPRAVAFENSSYFLQRAVYIMNFGADCSKLTLIAPPLAAGRIHGRIPVIIHTEDANVDLPTAPVIMFMGPTPFEASPYFRPVSSAVATISLTEGMFSGMALAPYKGETFVAYGNKIARGPTWGQAFHTAPGPISSLVVSEDSRYIVYSMEGSTVVRTITTEIVAADVTSLDLSISASLVMEARKPTGTVLADTVEKLKMVYLASTNAHYIYATFRSGSVARLDFDWRTGFVSPPTVWLPTKPVVPVQVIPLGEGVVTLSRSGELAFWNGAETFAAKPTWTGLATPMLYEDLPVRSPFGAAGDVVIDRIYAPAKYASNPTFDTMFYATSVGGDLWAMSCDFRTQTATIHAHVRLNVGRFRAVAISPIVASTSKQMVTIVVFGVSGKTWIVSHTVLDTGVLSHSLEVNAAAQVQFEAGGEINARASAPASAFVVAAEYRADSTGIQVLLSNRVVMLLDGILASPSDLADLSMSTGSTVQSVNGPVYAGIRTAFSYFVLPPKEIVSGDKFQFSFPPNAAFWSVSLTFQNGTTAGPNIPVSSAAPVYATGPQRDSTPVTVLVTVGTVPWSILKLYCFRVTATLSPIVSFPIVAQGLEPPTGSWAKERAGALIEMTALVAGVTDSVSFTSYAPTFRTATPSRCAVITSVFSDNSRAGDDTNLVIGVALTMSNCLVSASFDLPEGLDIVGMASDAVSTDGSFVTTSVSVVPRVQTQSGKRPVYSFDIFTPLPPQTFSVRLLKLKNSATPRGSVRFSVKYIYNGFLSAPLYALAPPIVAVSAPAWNPFAYLAAGDFTSMLVDATGNFVFVGTASGHIHSYSTNKTLVSTSTVFSAPITHLAADPMAQFVFAFADSTSEGVLLHRLDDGRLFFDPASIYDMSSRRQSLCKLTDVQLVEDACAVVSVEAVLPSSRSAVDWLVGLYHFAVNLRNGFTIGTARTGTGSALVTLHSRILALHRYPGRVSEFHFFGASSSQSLTASASSSAPGSPSEVPGGLLARTRAVSPTTFPFYFSVACGLRPTDQGHLVWLLSADSRVAIFDAGSTITARSLLIESDPFVGLPGEVFTAFDAVPSGQGVLVGTSHGRVVSCTAYCGATRFIACDAVASAGNVLSNEPVRALRITAAGTFAVALQKSGVAIATLLPELQIISIQKTRPETITTLGMIDRDATPSLSVRISWLAAVASRVSASANCLLKFDFAFDRASSFASGEPPVQFSLYDPPLPAQLVGDSSSGSCTLAPGGDSIQCVIERADSSDYKLEGLRIPNYHVLGLKAVVTLACNGEAVARSAGIEVGNLHGIATLERPGAPGEFSTIIAGTRVINLRAVPGIFIKSPSTGGLQLYTLTVADLRPDCLADQYNATTGFPFNSAPSCCSFGSSPVDVFSRSVAIRFQDLDSPGTSSVWVRCASSRDNAVISVEPVETESAVARNFFSLAVPVRVLADIEIFWAADVKDPVTGDARIRAGPYYGFYLRHRGAGDASKDIIMYDVTGDPDCAVCMGDVCTPMSEKYSGQFLALSPRSSGLMRLTCSTTGNKADLIVSPAASSLIQFTPQRTRFTKVTSGLTVSGFTGANFLNGVFDALSPASFALQLAAATYHAPTVFRATPSVVMPAGSHYCEIREDSVAAPWSADGSYQSIFVPAASTSRALELYCANMVSEQDRLHIVFSDPLGEYDSAESPLVVTRGRIELLRDLDAVAESTDFLLIATNTEPFRFRATPPPSRGVMFRASVTSAPASGQCSISPKPELVTPPPESVEFVAYDYDPLSDPFYVRCEGSTGAGALHVRVAREIGDWYEMAFNLEFSATGELRITQLTTPEIVLATQFIYSGEPLVPPTATDDSATHFRGSYVTSLRVEVVPVPPAADGTIPVTVTLDAVHACLIADTAAGAAAPSLSLTLPYSNAVTAHVIQLRCSGLTRNKALSRMFSFLRASDASFSYPTTQLPFVLEGTVELTLLDGSSVPELLAVNSPLHARLTSTLSEEVPVAISISDSSAGTCRVSVQRDDPASYTYGPLQVTYLPNAEGGRSVYILCDNPTADASTHVRVRNPDTRGQILLDWDLTGVGAAGTVFLTPSGSSHTAPLPPSVLQDQRQSLWLYVDPRTPADFDFEVRLVNPGTSPAQWASCALYDGGSNTPVQSLVVSVGRGEAWSPQFGYACTSLAAIGPSIVITAAHGSVGYTEFFGSALTPRGYGTFLDQYNLPLLDTIPLSSPYVVQVPLYPQAVPGLVYEFSLYFSSPAGQCRMWRYNSEFDLDVGSNGELAPVTVQVNFTDADTVLRVVVYCLASAVTGPSLVFAPRSHAVWFQQKQSAMMAINGVVTLIQTSADGDPIYSQVLSPVVVKDVQTLFSLYVQPTVPEDTVFRVEITTPTNAGGCALRAHDIGATMTPTGFEGQFANSVDILLSRGVASPTATNVPAGVRRRALILRCTRLPGAAVMPNLRVSVVTSPPALMYSTVVSRETIGVAGRVTLVETVSGLFPTEVSASAVVALTLTLSPAPVSATTLRVGLAQAGAQYGDCMFSYKSSPYAATLIVNLAAGQTTDVLSMRCMRVSNPLVNTVRVAHVSGERYAVLTTATFVVNAASTLEYLEPDSSSSPVPWIAMPSADAAGSPRTIVTTHTATRMRLVLPVPPAAGNSVEFNIALDSGAILQGIKGFFLSKSIVEASADHDAPFRAASPPTTIRITFTNSETVQEFYFYSTTPHQSGSNVIPQIIVTRVSGVAYLNTFGPRLRLRASVCASLTAPDPETSISYVDSIYYNKDWYPAAWNDVFYSHYSVASFSCAPGFYLADAGKRGDRTAVTAVTTMRCEAKEWVGPALTCEPVFCGAYARDTATTTSAHVTPNGRGHTDRFGAAVQARCIEGYVVGQTAPVRVAPLLLTETLTCGVPVGAPAGTTTGMWLQPGGDSPRPCQRVDCGVIDVDSQNEARQSMYVENSRIDGGTLLGAVASFTCNIGYEIDPGTGYTAVCSPKGYWEWTRGIGPKCVSLDCLTFPTSDHAEGDPHMQSITYDRAAAGSGNVYLPDTVATFTCRSGYRIRGAAGAQSTTALCTVERGWSIEPPRCEVLHCQKLSAPPGGSITYSPASLSSAATVPHLSTGSVVCPTGYNPFGSDDRSTAALPKTCTDLGGTAGTWTGPETFCKIHLCDPVLTSNVTITYANNGDNEERSYLSEAISSCPPGFEVSPRSVTVRTCHELGVGWVPGVDPVCSAMTCPILRAGPHVANIAYTVATHGARRLGSRALFTCDDGYVIQDQTSDLECSPQGTWVHPQTGLQIGVPQCTRNNCKQLPMKRHGHITYVDRGYGATFKNSLAIVSCEAGFQVQPGRSSTLICTDQRWEPFTAQPLDPLPTAEPYDAVPFCVDIDECAEVDCGATYGPGSECVNTVGGYACTPYIANYTMRLTGADKLPIPVTYPEAGPVDEAKRSVNLVDTAGSDRLTFRVFTGTNVAAWASAEVQRFAHSRVRGVRYERLTAPYVKFDCTLNEVTAVANLPGFQRISCLTSPGGGTDLAMSLYFCTSRRFTVALTGPEGDEMPLEQEGVSCMWTRVATPADKTKRFPHVYHVNYPPPTSTPSSLRSATFNDRTGSPSLVGRTTNGQKETVILSGSNFFANPIIPGVMTVVFGPLAMLQAPDALTRGYKCSIDADDAKLTTTSLIYCEMDFESGLDLHFLIDVLGQSVISSDTFSFPIKLSVQSISGCDLPADPALAHTTVGCPTSGNMLMTVLGDGFLEPTAVYINGDECLLRSRDNQRVTCVLPPGTGTALSVIVTSGSQYFEVQSMLSFAAPVITSLSSPACTSIGPITMINCPRAGSAALTIRGSNLGAQGATIYIGGVTCANVRHDEDPVHAHALIRCDLPQGSRTQRSVVVFQRYGELSAESAQLSYTQCSPGTQDVNFGCEPCRAGTYTDTEGQTECKECAPGSYNSVAGMSSCSACRSGTYAPVGSSACTNCPRGTFSTGNAGSCTTCSVGAYSPNTGANSCLPCPYGGTSDADYAGCHCLSGFFLNHMKECESCMEGGDCSDTGTTFFNVLPLPGYYPTAMATDTAAPRVLRFALLLRTSLRLSVAFERQSLLSSLMRAMYEDPEITRDRMQILSAEPAQVPLDKHFDAADYAAQIRASGPRSLARPALAHVAPSNVEHGVSTRLAGADETEQGDAETGAELVPGVLVTIDVYPPVIAGGLSTEAVFARFIDLLRPPATVADTSEGTRYATLIAAARTGALSAATAADANDTSVMFSSFGNSVAEVTVNTAYSRSAFVNFEECLSPACVGGVSMCAEGYQGPLCTVCSTGYSKKTTYLCERCGSLSSRLGDIFVSVLIAVAICTILVVLSVRGTRKNLDLPRVIRSVSHVAYFKILVCAIQVWAIAAQFDFEWPGVLGSFMEVMDVAGNIGIDAITLDCFSSNIAAYGIEPHRIRPLFMTTIGAFVLPLFALIFPFFVLVPAYFVHRRRYTRELATVAYVAKLDAAANETSLRVAQRAVSDAAAAAEAAALANTDISTRATASQAAADIRRRELYGHGLALRTSMAKAAMQTALETGHGTSGRDSAGRDSSAQSRTGTPTRRGSHRGPSVEMQQLSPRRPSDGGAGPLAPPPVPEAVLAPLHFHGNASDDEDSSDAGADELFTEFNVDLAHSPRSRGPATSASSSGSGSVSTTSALSSSAAGRSAARAGVRPPSAFASASASTSASLGVSFHRAPVSPTAASPRAGASTSTAGSLSVVEFHVDDFVDEDDGHSAASASGSVRGFLGVSGAGAARAGRRYGAPRPAADARFDHMSAIHEESVDTMYVAAAMQPQSPVGSYPPSEAGSRRASVSGSDGSRASAAGSGSAAGSRTGAPRRGKSFRETLIGPRLTTRGMMRREGGSKPVAGDTVRDGDREQAIEAAGLGDREPSRSMSRSQLKRESMKRVFTGASLMDAVAAQQGTEYLQLQHDRRVFRFAVDRLAELLQTYQYIYICCIATALYLLHPNISRAFFRLIACKTVGSGSSAALDATVTNDDGTTIHYSAADFDLPYSSRRFVLADMSLVCFSGEHFAWMFTLGLALFVFWIVGVPLGFFLYLRRNASLLRAQPNQLPVAELRQRHRVEYGFAFLFLGFQPKWYYWFVAEMARKVLYVAVSIFFPGQMHVQLLLASFVAFSAISAQTAVRPFEQSVLEHFEFSSLLVTFILFFLANFYMIENEINNANRDAITAAIFAAFMLFFVVAAIVLVVLMRQNRRTEQIRNAVTVALRRNMDPAPLLQTWRREERKRRAAKKGKVTFNGDLRDMFIDNAEQDARLELDQYLDNEDRTDTTEPSAEIEAEVEDASTESSVSRSRSVPTTPSVAAHAGTASVMPASPRGGASASRDDSHSADATSSGSGSGSGTSRSGSGAAEVTVATSNITHQHSNESSLSRSMSRDRSAHSAVGHGTTAGSHTIAAASASAEITADFRVDRSAAVFVALSPSPQPSPSPELSRSPAPSASPAPGAVSPRSGTAAGAGFTGDAAKDAKKRKILRNKPVPRPASAAATPAKAASATGGTDAALLADLDQAIAAAHPGDSPGDDFVAQTIAAERREAAERQRVRESSNRFGAVDVAEGRPVFGRGAAPVAQPEFGGVAATLRPHASAVPAVAAVQPPEDQHHFFYRPEEADEDELEDVDVWAQNVRSGTSGYF